MLVQLVDPAAYTPPYDHALASALVRAGAQVDLLTTASPEWDAALATGDGGYTRRALFYRRGAGLGSPWRALARATQHPAGMARLARAAGDLTHLQWAPIQELDALLLPRRRPLVVTAHDVLPREARPLQRRAQAAIYRRADAVVAHSEHGARRLADEAGVDPGAIRVIPHGAFEHLAAAPRSPLPPELGARRPGIPVALSFGLIRPYKGTDLLLRAWRQLPGDAELWIVGRPRGVDLGALRALADERVRFVPRFVTDGELAACFDAADLAVLPYREIEQSGVLATALAFGVPVLASAVGAFPEAEALGAARTVAAGDEPALAAGLAELLADQGARARLAEGAHALAHGAWSWDAVAAQHVRLYRDLLR